MTWPTKIIISETVAIAILCIIVYWLYGHRITDIQNTAKSENKQTTTLTPKTPQEVNKCATAPIEQDGIFSKNWFIVRAWTPCQSSERAYKMEAVNTPPKNILSGGLMTIYIDGKIRMLPGAGYSRSLWRSLYIGGQIFSNGTDHAGIINASLSF